VDDTLVVLVEEVFLLCESVWVQCDCEFVGGLCWLLEIRELALVDTFAEIKGLLVSCCFGFGFWVQFCRLFDVFIAEYVVVEAVLGLPLVLGGFEGGCIQPEGVMGTTCVPEVRFVEEGP
jgi:hypothetical protein